MPRIARGRQGLHVFHILNRGNARGTVFRSASEFRDFIDLMRQAKERTEVEVYAFAILPNHFHAVVKPRAEGALSAFMQWWLTSHVRRAHKRRSSSGHVWQGRFKSFPVETSEHLLTVLRYVLLNPLRASLASTPREWPFSSLRYPQMLDPWPIAPPAHFDQWLGEGLSEDQLVELRRSVARRAPFGSSEWTEAVAREAGLESTLRPRGRPRVHGTPTPSPEAYPLDLAG